MNLLTVVLIGIMSFIVTTEFMYYENKPKYIIVTVKGYLAGSANN